MLAAVTLLTGLLGASWFFWTYIYADFLTMRVENAAGDELDEAMKDLLRLGPAGMDRLTALLGAPRAEARDAAFRAAFEEIDCLGRIQNANAAAALDRMAAALAKDVSRFDREQLRLAGRLAERLLGANNFAASSERLCDCQVVIAADIRRRLAEQPQPDGQVALSFTALLDNEVPAIRRGNRSMDEVSLPPIGLPAPNVLSTLSGPQRLDASLTTEAKPIHDQEQAASIEAVNDERPDEAAPSAKDAVNRVQGAAATDNKDDPVSPSSLPRATESKTRLRSSIDAERDSKSDRSPPNRAASLRPANLSRMLDLDLRLRSDDNSTVDEAREEMARDKVDETQIKLARGAVDPDPDVRRELVEALSYIDVVDTRSWLLYLSHDQDAKVRLAVIARIASSEHAEFKKRLAELADGDGDERVRRQARVAVESNKER